MSSHAATAAQQSSPARRTIVKGAAWAVPAIAIAAPASAASCSSPVTPIGCGNGCQHRANASGRRHLHFVMCWTNTCGSDVTVTVGDVSVGGVVRDAMVNCQPTGSGPAGCPTFVVPAGGTLCKHVDAGRFPAEATGEALLTWSYRDPSSGTWLEGTPVGTGVSVDDTMAECDWGNPPHDGLNPLGCSTPIATSEPATDTASSTAEPQG